MPGTSILTRCMMKVALHHTGQVQDSRSSTILFPEKNHQFLCQTSDLLFSLTGHWGVQDH